MAALQHTFRANSGGQIALSDLATEHITRTLMLIAYLDEFGHQGPYIRHDHPKFNTHPCFGYAGYILPAENVRKMGGYFKYIKENLLAWELSQSEVPADQWEKKGSALLTSNNFRNYEDEMVPALRRIYGKLGKLEGQLFFYGQQKPVGPVSETHETSQDRESHCLIQAINRLGTIAHDRNEKMLVIMDATDTDNRERAVATLGATIYTRNNSTNKSIIEVPLQTESHLYNTVQLADWTCALLGRLTDYHFAEYSDFSWAVDVGRDIFNRAKPTENSIIWSNATSMHSRCFPNGLVVAQRFWEREQRKEVRDARNKEKNSQMFQRLIDAGSDELKAKLEQIRHGSPDTSNDRKP
ncbi:hypothetical protein CDBH8_0451 [Corynebacterium diphtheriae BH8]|uniref:DUF3800 domain-containing protein n=2 Tax=Corynebacterium diphtheriae TaxID=1717 RepID=UPI000245B122|nr:DUF3800 domain-containing protein [Corynebacterium diphtheriae]AEX47976.1 hypothetical protein CDBH8_0451 [Corynebacterium diphtheriae BH8]MBG9356203.1 DUF3800 domain-containing protein [Corynebacterium diphtheriae bv. mitis]TBX18736.1 hypothetical protein BUW94_05145 [Corynebacterium diphtheriae]